MGCFLTPVRLLQVYFVLTCRTRQGLYLRQVAFVQRLISTRFSSPLNYKFLPPNCPKRLREPCHEAGGGRSSQPRIIRLGHIGLIQVSLDTQGIGRRISLVCQTMLWKLLPAAKTLQVVLEVEGESDLLTPNG